jgi:hypothetical protein
MGDYQGAVPTRTVRDDEFKIKIVDFASGESATAGLKIEADGSVNTNSKITDGTHTLEINADGSINSVVTATDLDIRDLTHVSDSVKVGDGTDVLAVNADGSINVRLDDGTEVCDYGTSAAVAANADGTFDYVVTSGKTFEGECVTVGARGAVKVQIGTSADGVAFTPKKVVFQQPAENGPIAFPTLKLLGDGTALVRVIVTNLDKAASDLYCTIEGTEN